MNFIPNPLEWFMDFPDSKCPPNFEEGGYEGLYLSNQGKLIFIGFFILIGFIIAANVIYFKNVFKIRNYSISDLSKGTKNVIVRLAIIFYADIMTSVALQFWNFEYNSDSEIISWRNGLSCLWFSVCSSSSSSL